MSNATVLSALEDRFGGLAVSEFRGDTRIVVPRALLFETPATDPVTFLTVAAVIASAAMLACWVPARRSTRVDPGIALRAE